MEREKIPLKLHLLHLSLKMPRVGSWAAVKRFPFDCVQVDVPEALWALTFRRTKDWKKTVAGEEKWELRGWQDHRSCRNIFRGTQIWDSYRVKFTFVLASWTRRWDCWAFHTQPFTHSVLCSVKLASDVALSEQRLSEQSPWGLIHLCKQERPGRDICCLVWILVNARSVPRLCTLLHSPVHTTILHMITEFIQSVSANASCHLHISALLEVIWGYRF